MKNKIKSLCLIKKKKSGRSRGKISVRHIGKKHKKFYRKIDFKRDKYNIKGIVESIHYDPNRNARIALIKYLDGEKRYIIKTNNLEISNFVVSSLNKISLNSGNSTIIKNINIGTLINCVEIFPKIGGIFSRSSGSESEIIFKDNKFGVIKLPSGIKKKISLNCMATIGKICTFNVKKKLYKAGQNRWRGIRPTVRGVAMNPVDHPHGGGEGKTSGGRHPCSLWGIKTKGYKTKKK
ncbi:ribosomal protein L2 [Candidatus Carsonella ruddii PV]|uniref:Large ribosomal subunit protein uL2 n=1 Tax=Carsonella ruddii (strain PV) TaxID=387662 RepID=RL2_CARRP|nr:50S ribosomal protein L2 [Candidatus Carsonella ruddii]Q05FI7.1 RecName: Full=Large ribosomal subunit protein uL2; AltName: Full=50S ribosomal protein L2 [Candidatus Carsonella ruddii PV]BAF35184.1 ribosomal protein L2 [Candidatus Carsonella ruddii PV]